MARRYFSQRKSGAPAITTQDFVYRFYNIYLNFQEGLYFSRLGAPPGHRRDLVSDKMRRGLAIAFGDKSYDMHPTWDKLEKMSRDSIFDLIEFLSEHVSEPYNADPPPDPTVRAKRGLEKWRKSVNECLEQLAPPHNLNANREIETASPSVGLRHLVDNHASPSPDAQQKIDHACRLFLKRDATVHDRRSALKELADVLEPLRDDLNNAIGKKMAGKLFDIANNYGIRHNNKEQLELDENYMRWFFYSSLSTIDLVANLGKSGKGSRQQQDAAES